MVSGNGGISPETTNECLVNCHQTRENALEELFSLLQGQLTDAADQGDDDAGQQHHLQQAGIDMASSANADIILMDLSLPVIDGWEATRRIKAAPVTQAIPVIALTAHAMAGDEQKALAAGCDDYGTKPVNLNRLLGKSDKLLGAGSLRTDTPRD